MEYYETIHTDTNSGFDIVFSAAPETDAPDWDFENDQDRQDTLRRINNGSLAYFIARVQAFKHGVLLGTDYLGGCCYDTPMQFVKDNDYYADMVQTAINEANQQIAKLCAAN